MKKNTFLLCLLILIFTVPASYAQKYKNVEDTVKLNKEYVAVSNDIADLSAKLTIAQNDLPGYQSKASKANNDASDAASSSSEHASKATNGSVSDARTAKKKASKAYSEAKDSRAAEKKVSNQENKITKLKLDIKKKQQRLQDLDIMRTAIAAKITADSLQLIAH
ncbi:hypothetical protein BH11BAC4_BH11BAC4_26770 [soil metagenome]